MFNMTRDSFEAIVTSSVRGQEINTNQAKVAAIIERMNILFYNSQILDSSRSAITSANKDLEEAVGDLQFLRGIDPEEEGTDPLSLALEIKEVDQKRKILFDEVLILTRKIAEAEYLVNQQVTKLDKLCHEFFKELTTEEIKDFFSREENLTIAAYIMKIYRYTGLPISKVETYTEDSIDKLEDEARSRGRVPWAAISVISWAISAAILSTVTKLPVALAAPVVPSFILGTSVYVLLSCISPEKFSISDAEAKKTLTRLFVDDLQKISISLHSPTQQEMKGSSAKAAGAGAGVVNGVDTEAALPPAQQEMSSIDAAGGDGGVGVGAWLHEARTGVEVKEADAPKQQEMTGSVSTKGAEAKADTLKHPVPGVDIGDVAETDTGFGDYKENKATGEGGVSKPGVIALKKGVAKGAPYRV